MIIRIPAIRIPLLTNQSFTNLSDVVAITLEIIEEIPKHLDLCSLKNMAQQ